MNIATLLSFHAPYMAGPGKTPAYTLIEGAQRVLSGFCVLLVVKG